MSSNSWEHAAWRDREVLTNPHGYLLSKNREVVDGISVKHASIAMDKASLHGGEEKKSKMLYFFEDLGRFAIRTDQKLVDPSQLQRYQDDINRPADFDISKMIVERGIVAEAEEIQNSAIYKEKMRMLRFPGVGLQTVAALREKGIRTPEEFEADLRKPKDRRRWKPRSYEYEEGQLEYLKVKEDIKFEITLEECQNLTDILRYMLTEFSSPVDVDLERGGSGGAGRFKGHDRDFLVIADVWTRELEEKWLGWLNGKHATEEEQEDPEHQPKVFFPCRFVYKPASTADRSKLPSRLSSNDGVSFATVGQRGFDGKITFLDLWFVERRNLPVMRALVHSSAYYSDCLMRHARRQGKVLSGFGGYENADWTSGGESKLFKDEREVFDWLCLDYFPSSHRRPNLTKDGICWIGISEEDLKIRLGQEGEDKSEKKGTRGKKRGAAGTASGGKSRAKKRGKKGSSSAFQDEETTEDEQSTKSVGKVSGGQGKKTGGKKGGRGGKSGNGGGKSRRGKGKKKDDDDDDDDEFEMGSSPSIPFATAPLASTRSRRTPKQPSKALKSSCATLSNDEVQASKEQEIHCFCGFEDNEDMVACDSGDCKFEWFHYTCVDIVTVPEGSWYCGTCSGMDLDT